MTRKSSRFVGHLVTFIISTGIPLNENSKVSVSSRGYHIIPKARPPSCRSLFITATAVVVKDFLGTPFTTVALLLSQLRISKPPRLYTYVR